VSGSAILVTGAAGFIGYHVAERLLERGDRVVGADNLNDYYDVALKRARLDRLRARPGFQFHETDLVDPVGVQSMFQTGAVDRVVHLAAQAGVRYSLTNPHAYGASNLVGFLNVVECARRIEARHFVYASSSSVYGANTKLPYSVHDRVDHPISLYAATKRANEAMAHAYSHLYRLPTTGLRFFTVYGPWGRPDMAYFSFTRAIFEGKPIEVFNHGDMRRDFTYIDDVVAAVLAVLDRPAQPDPTWSPATPDASSSAAPYRLYNIGNHTPVDLMRFIRILEGAIGRKAEIRFRDLQPGDVLETAADVEALSRDVGFAPSTPLEIGLPKFVNWYREFYRVT
jgi:UDP-glucuronate 4-epimerase